MPKSAMDRIGRRDERPAAELIKFVGEDRHGFRVDKIRKRVMVPRGSQGMLVKRGKDHCGHLVEFKIKGKRVRLYAPGWELRKLVKK